MSFYEEALAARFAAQEPMSVSWLARTTSVSAKYNDCDEARVALGKFGSKRKADADVTHVVSGSKRCKSGFSGLDIPRVEIALVAEKDVESQRKDLDDADAGLYCVAPTTRTSELWFVDAERSKVLMSDAGDAGDAFRENRGAKIRFQGLTVAPAADWSGAAKPVPKKPAPPTQKAKFASFFTAKPSSPVPKKKDAPKKEAPKVVPKKNDVAEKNEKKTKQSSHFQPKPKEEPKAEKPRRRIIDDDDDDDDDDDEPEPAPVVKDPPKAGPRLVEKTFVDEKGYLVTHKIWENQAAVPSPAAPRPAPPPPPKTKKALPKPKPKKAKPQPKGQSSMFSYFKKV